MHTRTLKAEDEVKVRQLKADPKWTRFVDPGVRWAGASGRVGGFYPAHSLVLVIYKNGVVGVYERDELE